MKKLTYALVIFTSLLFLGLTFSYNPLMANPTDEFDEERDMFLNILTVNKEQYNMTKALVGNKHNVEYLFSNESDMKSFEVSDNVKSNILNMDLFIYNGLGYETWINDIIDDAKNSSVGIINMSRGIRAITTELFNENKENPYYLLGFNEYKIALYNIKTALQERDIINRNYYEENYNTIVEELDEFLTKSKEELNKYKEYYIVTDSDKFDYLLKDLGIQAKKLKSNEEVKDIVNESKDSKIIFIHDNKLGNLDDLKNKIAISCNYIELNTEGDNNILKDNVTKIIDSVKNKN
ncbi:MULTISPECIES: zinc ABC transporter substrate-binding protein [unclassified Clostridium]|uniref:metal ABC transporter substrate-binding protein n=1 Tax=unclassified Clostridium TaxID=2614128 RepID=UPI0018974467|nr:MULTISPECIES: zinc ABC transporter substrate-binding protein [unclassified Clostridium]MCR1951798.1 zinc ABC transporter substrate-binding protein [Clostridium sp. DSM 100503]